MRRHPIIDFHASVLGKLSNPMCLKVVEVLAITEDSNIILGQDNISKLWGFLGSISDPGEWSLQTIVRIIQDVKGLSLCRILKIVRIQPESILPSGTPYPTLTFVAQVTFDPDPQDKTHQAFNFHKISVDPAIQKNLILGTYDKIRMYSARFHDLWAGEDTLDASEKEITKTIDEYVAAGALAHLSASPTYEDWQSSQEEGSSQSQSSPPF